MQFPNTRLVSIDPAYMGELARLDAGISSYMIPTVIERENEHERAYDIYSKMLKDRVVFLGTAINDAVANVIIAQLLHLESVDPDDEITMYIQSPGGYCSAGFAIYSTMRGIKCPMRVVCMGIAASMGAFLLTAGGDRGKRVIMPTAEVMIHQPLGGAQGQATEILIRAKNIELTKRCLTSIIAKSCGKADDYAQVHADMERDYYMSAEQALAYGLVDEIYQTEKEIILPDPAVMARPIFV